MGFPKLCRPGTVAQVIIMSLLLVLGLSSLSLAKTTISFWYTFSPQEEPQMKRILDQFASLYPDIEVVATNMASSGGDYWEKLVTAFAGGVAPDVYFVAPGLQRQFMMDNSAYDLTRLVNRDSSEIALTDFLEPQHAELMYGGKWKGLPYDFSVFGLYYNKEIFNNAGIPYPDESWTWSDLVAAGKKLTERVNGEITRWGLDNVNFVGSFWGEGFYKSYGGNLFNAEGTRSTANSVGIIEALASLENIVNSGITPLPGQNGLGGFFNGKVAMTVGTSWDTMVYRSQAKFDFDVAVLPAAENGKRVVTGGGGAYSVYAGTGHLEQAWTLVKHLTSQQSIRTFVVEPIRSVPARKSLMRPWADSIAMGGRPPQNAMAFCDSILKYGGSPSLVNFDFSSVQWKYAQQIITGRLSPVSAAAQIEAALNTELDRIRKQLQ